MKRIDLRPIGKLFGLPLYVDVAELKDEDSKNLKQAMIRNVLTQFFTPPPTPKEDDDV